MIVDEVKDVYARTTAFDAMLNTTVCKKKY